MLNYYHKNLTIRRNKMGPINYIFPENNLEIQNHLDLNSLKSYSRVCHSWNELVTENDQLWKRIFPGIFFPKEMKAKEYLNLNVINCLKSSDSVIALVEKLRSKLILGQTGTLNCLLPSNKYGHCFKMIFNTKFNAQYLDLEIKHHSYVIENLEDNNLKETYIFMKTLKGLPLKDSSIICNGHLEAIQNCLKVWFKK